MNLDQGPTNRTLDADWMRSRLFVPLALLGITLAIFWRALLMPGDSVLSYAEQDTANLFVYQRQFGFEQLRAGRIALWNPHVFSGAPFMGGFQAALFYPLNLIYLFLPLAKAINCEIALHVFLMGLFTALWVERYRLHPLAILIASSAVMFSGASFLHIYAGHLPQLDSMAWVPLILLTIDNLLDAPDSKWILVGTFAFAMQLFAGYPQVVYYTVITCGLYAAMRVAFVPRPLKTILCLAVVALGALLITTVQLWTGLETASEGTRQGGAELAIAASFSLPPENLITMLVPRFFGNLTSYPYWGQWYLWETCSYFGLTALTMALFGLTVKVPHKRVWLTMAIVLLWIAMGAYTPLFPILYRYLPGFAYFRSPSKFVFEAVLFLAMLSAFGTDALIRSPRGARLAAAGALTIAALILGPGAWMRTSAEPASWDALINTIAQSGKEFLPSAVLADPSFAGAAWRFAGAQCLIAGATLFVLAILLLARAYRPGAACLLAVFGVVEVFVFAHSSLTSFPLSAKVPLAARPYLDADPGDYRTLGLNNGAIMIGANDLWGYDPPAVMRRYQQFVGFSQGNDAEDPTSITIRDIGTPLFRMLRLGLVLVPQDPDYKAFKVLKVDGALPHLLLVDGWQQMQGRAEILGALAAASFDPRKTVILESAPSPRPVPGDQPGAVQILHADTGSLAIAADVPRPMLLLVTDAYSRYWRAVPMPGSSQNEYHLMPADYTLMAVPLAAGHHQLRIEYAPPGWLIGRWISLAALLIYLIAVAIFLSGRRSAG
jgi:hypothetical protein